MSPADLLRRLCLIRASRRDVLWLWIARRCTATHVGYQLKVEYDRCILTIVFDDVDRKVFAFGDPTPRPGKAPASLDSVPPSLRAALRREAGRRAAVDGDAAAAVAMEADDAAVAMEVDDDVERDGGARAAPDASAMETEEQGPPARDALVLAALGRIREYDYSDDLDEKTASQLAFLAFRDLAYSRSPEEVMEYAGGQLIHNMVDQFRLPQVDPV